MKEPKYSLAAFQSFSIQLLALTAACLVLLAGMTKSLIQPFSLSQTAPCFARETVSNCLLKPKVVL